MHKRNKGLCLSPFRLGYVFVRASTGQENTMGLFLKQATPKDKALVSFYFLMIFLVYSFLIYFY
jgi:hypothetical protein